MHSKRTFAAAGQTGELDLDVYSAGVMLRFR
jgi:hypothetical protein